MPSRWRKIIHFLPSFPSLIRLDFFRGLKGLKGVCNFFFIRDHVDEEEALIRVFISLKYPHA